MRVRPTGTRTVRPPVRSRAPAARTPPDRASRRRRRARKRVRASPVQASPVRASPERAGWRRERLRTTSPRAAANPRRRCRGSRFRPRHRHRRSPRRPAPRATRRGRAVPEGDGAFVSFPRRCFGPGRPARPVRGGVTGVGTGRTVPRRVPIGPARRRLESTRYPRAHDADVRTIRPPTVAPSGREPAGRRRHADRARARARRHGRAARHRSSPGLRAPPARDVHARLHRVSSAARRRYSRGLMPCSSAKARVNALCSE